MKKPKKISSKNCIGAYIHCAKCLKEIPAGVAPVEWAWISIGWTKIGFQVFCNRHKVNVMHIDLQGQKHPANESAKS